MLRRVPKPAALQTHQVRAYVLGPYADNVVHVIDLEPGYESAHRVLVVLQRLCSTASGFSVEDKGGESRVEWRPYRLWSQRKVLQHIVVALRSLEPQPVVVLGPKGYYIFCNEPCATRTRDNLLKRQGLYRLS